MTTSQPYCVALALLTAALLPGCTSQDQSLLIYRLPYLTGAEVRIWQDHLTHSGGEPAIDMAGVNGNPPYTVVAAQAGTLRLIEDTLSVNCCGGSCGNNYVWVEHIGGEWTKYSHLATGSVTGAGHEPGEPIAAGQFLGFESNVGRACGSNNGTHTHFEVRLVEDTESPSPDILGDLDGPMRIPRFCGVANQTVVMSEEYIVAPCPN